MFNWGSQTLEILNLLVIFLLAILVVKDVRNLGGRMRCRIFGDHTKENSEIAPKI